MGVVGVLVNRACCMLRRAHWFAARKAWLSIVSEATLMGTSCRVLEIRMAALPGRVEGGGGGGGGREEGGGGAEDTVHFG